MAHPKRRQSKTRTAKRRTHREELMIKQWLLHWLFARIVVNGMYITRYVEHAVIIEENLL